MKNLFQYGCCVVLSLPITSLAAETAKRESGGSMLLVYLFLGVCGLIILLQLLPVIAMFFALIKGIFGKRQEAKTVPVKHR